MLELRNVNISTYMDRKLIDNLSFTLDTSDKLCIIGEEGNGKSTLLKYIVDENSINKYCKCSGTIKKEDLKLGYLEQFLDSKWNEMNIVNYLFSDNNMEIDYEKYENIAKTYKLFEKFNLDKEYLEENKKIKTLSGGEKVKVQLTKLLLEEPDILLLDEPTNDLDIETLEWLEEYIINSKIPVIFISHDEVLLERAANCVLHLEQIDNKTKSKWTYEHIKYNEYVEKRIYNINRQNSISVNEKREYDKQMQKFRQIEQNVDTALNKISRQEPFYARKLKVKMRNVKAMEKRLENKDLTKKVYVEENIIAKFHNENDIYNKKVILDYNIPYLKNNDRILSKDIKLKIVGNEKICIIGGNGVGKTTLLKQIYEYLIQEKNNKCGYMPQNYEENLDLDKSPIEFLKSDYSKEEETVARTYLGSMKFTKEEMLDKIENLSGGQKAKLYLVKLIIDKCNILLLDEPTRNLSPLSNPVVRKILAEFDGVIISISHDRKYIGEIPTIVYELRKEGLSLVKK